MGTKGIAAVVAIAAAVGGVYLIVSRAGARGANQPTRTESDYVGGQSAMANENADKAPTRMPPSNWNELIANAIQRDAAPSRG